jgi:proteasome lid subunit RPN8/RPN11
MDFYHLEDFQEQTNLKFKMIDKKIKNFIKQQSIKDFPMESCGFIVKNNKSFICIPCKNISKSPEKTFEISSIDFLKTKALYNKIYYIYHSHVNEQDDYFSEEDEKCSENLNIPIILYHLKKDLYKIYSPVEISSNYIGRFYEYKKYDCFTLIKDFYKNEKNINLNVSYEENLNDVDIKDKIYNFHKVNNFEILDKNQGLKLYDILFFSGFGTKHLGLYLGENKILHQPMFGFSKIENYCNFYRRHTDLILRLKI